MLSSVLFTALITVTPGAECPQFRGLAGSGWQAERRYPDRWSTTENVAWSAAVPGGGWSAPVVSGKRVFVSTAISPEWPKPLGYRDSVATPESRGSGGTNPSEPVTFQALCYDLEDGSLQWTATVAEQVPAYPIHPSNTFATETPATDGEHLYLYFGAIGLVCCLDLDGEEVWRRDVGAYPMNAGFGTGSSVSVFDGLLFVQSDNAENSFLVAFDTESGEEMWRNERPTGSGWASPTLWTHRDGIELVTCGPGAVISYDPETGDEVWRLDDIPGSFTSSPTHDEMRVYFGNSGPGTRGPLVAVEAGAMESLKIGSEQSEGVAWHERGEGPGFSSPVVIGDHLYVVGSGGTLRCFAAETGERVYRERLPDSATIAASLWASGDRLFILNETGTTFVVKAGDKFELLHQNQIDDLFWSTPSVAGNALLLRGVDRLYCVRASL